MGNIAERISAFEANALKKRQFEDAEQRTFATGRLALRICLCEHPEDLTITANDLIRADQYLSHLSCCLETPGLLSIKNDPVMRRMQDILSALPRHDQCMIISDSLENLVLEVAENVHAFWLECYDHLLADDAYDQQFRHLPFYLIGWTEVQKYVENVLAVMTCFDELELSIDDVEKSYHSYVAIDLCQIMEDEKLPTSLAELLSRSLTYEFSVDEESCSARLLKYCMDKKHLERLGWQIANYGLGDIDLVQRYMQTLQDVLVNASQMDAKPPMNVEFDVALKQARESCQ